MDRHNFFYCYDIKLMKFLKNEKGFSYILKAIHPKTVKLFWLFYMNTELNQAIDEYMKVPNGT